MTTATIHLNVSGNQEHMSNTSRKPALASASQSPKASMTNIYESNHTLRQAIHIILAEGVAVHGDKLGAKISALIIEGRKRGVYPQPVKR